MIDAPPDLPTRKHVWLVFILFAAAAVASFGYCLTLGQFNGDFFPQPVFLSPGIMAFILVACLLPYLITWRLSGFLERFPPSRTFTPSPRALFVFLLVSFTAHIGATLLYGVAVLDAEVYSAPAIVRPFIQALNRLDPFYLGAFFILATPKSYRADAVVIALMVATGLLRSGLGAFAYVIIAMAIKYRSELLMSVRRYPWLVIFVLFTLPSVISALYAVRGDLRGDVDYDYSLSEMLLGRFAGRLSAFSNISYIQQNSQSFVWGASGLEPLYYIKQAATSLLGSGVIPDMTPERLLIAGNRSYLGYSSFMTGVPGNLMLSWYLSPAVMALNLAFILAAVIAILWCSRYLGGGVARTFGLGMLFYPLTSGVASEFSSLLINTLLFLVFSILFGVSDDRERGAIRD